MMLQLVPETEILRCNMIIGPTRIHLWIHYLRRGTWKVENLE